MTDTVPSQRTGRVLGHAVRKHPMRERREVQMTDVKELDEQIAEALALIDRGLGDMLHRELVSTDEVADLLLDVRTLLTVAEPVAN